MRRLRDRKLLLDLGMTGVIALLLAVSGTWSPADGALGLVLVVAGLAPLPLRRRFPGWVLGIVTAATVAHLLTSVPRNLDYLPVLLALYAAPGSSSVVVRWGGSGLATIAVALAMAPAKGPVQGTLLAAAICGVAWALGMERQRHVAERAEFAALRTRHRMERVAAQRRERTARRLHDTLARTTTVMLVQAETLRSVGRLTEPDRERVDQMLAAGRDALGQVRETLRELHGDEPELGPGLDDVLAQLVAAGLVLERAPEWPELPDAVRALAERVVAEAATNALRHNGPDVRLHVEVEAAGEFVALTVRNDRRGTTSGGTGYGLASLRGELAEQGGSLTAGAAGREWTVVAVIPCPARQAARSP